MSHSSPGRRRWSARVTENSDALDLRQGISFRRHDPKRIAASLKTLRRT